MIANTHSQKIKFREFTGTSTHSHQNYNVHTLQNNLSKVICIAQQLSINFSLSSEHVLQCNVFWA